MIRDAMRRFIASRLSPDTKRKIRARIASTRRIWARTVLRHDDRALFRGLLAVGVEKGDLLCVHARLDPFSGFAGSARDIVGVLLRAVGETGTLMMVSMPYRGATSAYLRDHPVFDVSRTPSKMGLLSEVLRRRPGVIRSLSPTHPVLAMGAKAEELVADHELCRHPCGAGSPFEKLLHRGGKILFFDVGPETMTFIHFLEHVAAGDLPFPLYAEEECTVTVRDGEGRERPVTVHAFSPQAVRRRNPQILVGVMRRRGIVRTRKVGGTLLQLVSASDALAAGEELMRRRPSFVFEDRDVPGRVP